MAARTSQFALDGGQVHGVHLAHHEYQHCATGAKIDELAAEQIRRIAVFHSRVRPTKLCPAAYPTQVSLLCPTASYVIPATCHAVAIQACSRLLALIAAKETS